MVKATKILLVEDSKFLRLEMERLMSRAGYAVSTAADGEQALRMAQDRLPDLILLDLLLPKISGPDVLKALKSEVVTADIPVVVLSGMSAKNSERLQSEGAYRFLEKSALELDKGARPLLAALREIIEALSRAATSDGIGSP